MELQQGEHASHEGDQAASQSGQHAAWRQFLQERLQKQARQQHQWTLLHQQAQPAAPNQCAQQPPGAVCQVQSQEAALGQEEPGQLTMAYEPSQRPLWQQQQQQRQQAVRHKQQQPEAGLQQQQQQAMHQGQEQPGPYQLSRLGEPSQHVLQHQQQAMRHHHNHQQRRIIQPRGVSEQQAPDGRQQEFLMGQPTLQQPQQQPGETPEKSTTDQSLLVSLRSQQVLEMQMQRAAYLQQQQQATQLQRHQDPQIQPAFQIQFQQQQSMAAQHQVRYQQQAIHQPPQHSFQQQEPVQGRSQFQHEFHPQPQPQPQPQPPSQGSGLHEHPLSLIHI
eukprot:TRINITY_DN20930_c0_g2_i1.p1 TRINITY_DN20930_c0_g2~~TRINITY_DN20930_c0_g2_i1.p1  ORF type:complete len:332 (-),score=88.25 TRINITY_DN20930_c0_g2_i1:89-1084(-)